MNISSSDIEAEIEAAKRLVEARNMRKLIPALIERLRPKDLASAYRIQAAWLAERGGDAAGWKIGCTSKRAQEHMGVHEPFAGVVLRPGLAESPANLLAGAFNQRFIECEFAFEIARPTPASDGPYTASTIGEYVAAVRPAIEVIDTAFADMTRCGALAAIADNALHGALVLGPRRADWQGLDLPTHKVRLTIAGKFVTEGTGAEALGHPLAALAWLANHLAARGGSLNPGEIVTTGTCTGVNEVPAGSSATADYGALGMVQLKFS
jgi:2-keto-4-pentenoate hydratase